MLVLSLISCRMELMGRLGLCASLLLGLFSVCTPHPIEEFEIGFISARKCDSTPLHLAVLSGTLEDLEKLISEGADMYALDCQGLSPMHLAIDGQISDKIVVLIENDFDLNFPFRNGETVLFYAIKKGNLNIIELLIKYGSYVNAFSSQGTTPLIEATLANQDKVIDLLKKYGASLTKKLSNGDTCLHRAAQQGNVRMVVTLIDKFKFAVDDPNNVGETPLTKAVTHNKPAVINVLVSRGADINRVVDGKTYVFLAVHTKSLNSLRNLLERNAQVSHYDETIYHSALFEAVKLNLKGVAESLVKHGASLTHVWSDDSRQEAGMNILHFAAEFGYDKAVPWLVDLGINVNSRTISMRSTPLHIAASHNQLDVAVALLEKGASVKCKDINEQVPVSYAESIKLQELLNSAKTGNCETN